MITCQTLGENQSVLNVGGRSRSYFYLVMPGIHSLLTSAAFVSDFCSSRSPHSSLFS